MVIWAITSMALLFPSSWALAATEDPLDPQPHMHQAKLFVPHNHGFRPRERPLYSVDIPQAVGDSFCVFFFVYTATWVKLA